MAQRARRFGYHFTTTTGQTATQTGPTTWLVSGLQPEEQLRNRRKHFRAMP